jgi:hypothetical protein
VSQLAWTVRHSPRHTLPALATLLLVLAVLALVWIARASADEDAPSSPSAVARSVSNVPTGKADAVDSTSEPCTSSISYTDMPDMSETFTLGGTASRPVIVLFQAAWQNNDPNGIAGIQLLIDGIIQPAGAISLQPAIVETDGFNFISATLAPGTHTAKMQWRSANQRSICVLDRSLIILHK